MKINLCKFCICWVFFINFTLNSIANKKHKYQQTAQKKFVTKQKKTVRQGQDFHPQVYPSIKFLCVCPRDYEYKKVVENLKPYTYNKGLVRLNNTSKKISLKNLRKQLSFKQGGVDFFKIENNIICVIECGRRQDAIAFTLGNVMALVGNHLELILVSGICGCSDNSIKIGSIMIPSCFYSLDSFSICNFSKKENIPLIRKDKLSIANLDYFSLPQNGSHIKLSKAFAETRTKIINLLDETYDCINFTSGCFIDNSHFCMEMIENFKDKSSINQLPHIFEMEDFALMDICHKRNIPCLCIRSVSDHAGQNKSSENIEDVFADYSSNEIQNSKEFASQKLGEALKKIFENISI